MPRTPSKLHLTVKQGRKSDEEIIRTLAKVGRLLIDEYTRQFGEPLADVIAREKSVGGSALESAGIPGGNDPDTAVMLAKNKKK